MKVYRFLSGEELQLIKSGQKDKLGNVFSKEMSNNFKYKEGQKYIHFFKRLGDIEYIKQIRIKEGNSTEYYICEFNIPLTVLLFTKGKGVYYELQGYELVTLTEFAIRAENFNPDWLTSYQQANIFDSSSNSGALHNKEENAER